MTITRAIVFAACCSPFIACLLPAQTGTKPAPAPTPQAATPARQPQARPIFDNEHVRVIEAVWEPGSSAAAWKGFPGTESLGVLAVVLKGGTVEHQYPGGKKVRRERRPGEVFWQAPDIAVEARQNVGNSRLDMVQVALKKVPLTRQYAGPVTGEKKRFENSRLVVFELALAPGAKIPMHKYGPRVWVILEGGDMRSWDNADKPQEARLGNSQVVWLPPQEHRLENIGKTNERIISVEMK